MADEPWMADREIAALRSELTAAMERERLAHCNTKAANARAERAIQLRKYAMHGGGCHFTLDNPCTCGLSDLLRELDAEDK